MNTSSLSSEEEFYNKRNRVRIAVSLFYFCQGLAFASWASRIPIIKEKLALTEAQLGTILLMLPAAQILTMALSGKLVSKYGSSKVLPIGAICYAAILCLIGFAENAYQLGSFLFLLGIAGNMCNIAVNTQGVAAEKIFKKSIMSSFHGAWSIAGFTGALIGLLTMNLGINTTIHFFLIFGLILLSTLINYKYLVPGKAKQDEKTSFFANTDKTLVQLGVIGFFSMATEGAMFDWSGVYFKEIVHAPEKLIIVGYASFMVMMAIGRFIGDAVIVKIGRRKTLQISGLLMFIGMMTSVLLPNFWICTAAFMLVGLGVACVVPTVFSLTGKHTKIPSGVALSIVSSISFLGFLLGPALIGYIAELLDLRYSYALFASFGLMLFIMTSKLKIFRDE